MAVLLLRLAGPMQAWGDSSRYARRTTRREPTKSGIVGLIASALGRSREEPVDDLARLEMAVRVEQPGKLMRDFQTERPMDGGKPMPLSNRYYLADACFLVALGGPDDLLVRIDAALRLPRHPLYLDSRSCPAGMPLSLGVVDAEDVRLVLTEEPWRASERYKSRNAGVTSFEIVADARDGEICESWADYPLTFSEAGRRYACRPVTRLRVPNPDNAVLDTGDRDVSAYQTLDVTVDHDPLGWME